MRQSKVLPILVGIFLLVAGCFWVWNILSIDYTRLRGQRSTPEPAQEQQAAVPAHPSQAAPEPGTSGGRSTAP